MMGRLTCTEEPEQPRTIYPAVEPPFMHPSKSIPHFRDLPAIPPDRSQSSQLHRNYFAEPLQDRARSAFQEPSYSVSEAKEIRRTALSPNLKLPPINPPRSTDMPPHHIPADVPPEGGKDKFPAYPDLSAAYDNMMVGYFMSQNTKADTYLPYKTQGMQLPPQQGYPSSGQPICHPNYVYQSPSDTNQLLQSDPLLSDPPPMRKAHPFQTGSKAPSATNSNTNRSTKNAPVNHLTAMDITSSGCTVLDASTFHKHSTAGFGGVDEAPLKPPDGAFPSTPTARDQQYADLSTVLDDISMFVTPQHTPVMMQQQQQQPRAFSAGGGTPYQYKQDLGRFSVLPPVTGDGDNLSLQSYSSMNPFLDFASSPRYSGRSSYSSRSRNKRALSNSPLSAEGIDLNSIIRMSPTSLVAYVNGSRSSSSCVSPGSAGEKAGCYGHLSARTSSSSPGSGSSGARRGSGMTPVDLLDNLLVIQAMQDMESELPPEFDNLQVLPQDLAAIRTEDYLPLVSAAIPTSLPPVHSHLRPPPTYDQHMARKASLQKAGSSDSGSQPSNSSSFESSEGTVGSSGTDTETAGRMYACRWLDCTAVFQDQDEFVTHIEKVHIDQKKGEDFVCFWKLCPRRLHPFNARYKLLVHMRIHSGDKPNKCTFAGCKKAFSRLENLKIHLRSHTGERPYSCVHPGCTKTFSNSSDRTKHQKTHHDTKPYVCQVVGCGKRYTDPSSLRKHIKKSHPEKKEPDRKKIRGGAEDLDPNDLSECLVIQAIKPIALCDTSPPEPTDSGLGRSPRSSQPGSSSDHYPGLVYTGETFPGSDLAPSICHTSPSSHHSSPRAQNDSEILSLNNSLRVPILPPLTPQNKNYSPVQKTPTYRNSSLL